MTTRRLAEVSRLPATKSISTDDIFRLSKSIVTVR
jgi:hypothetical protein